MISADFHLELVQDKVTHNELLMNVFNTFIEMIHSIN